MNKRETWCYKCDTKLWGEKPDPGHHSFTMGYCPHHGWVPDHEGMQVLTHCETRAFLWGFRNFMVGIFDWLFGFFSYALRDRNEN